MVIIYNYIIRFKYKNLGKAESSDIMEVSNKFIFRKITNLSHLFKEVYSDKLNDILKNYNPLFGVKKSEKRND
jgi:hypothetical protein